jgi:hypothetical protein
LDLAIENLPLLVAHVHHHAARDAEVVDHPNGVVEVTGAGVSKNVGEEGILTSVAHLPVPGQFPHAEEHAQNRPAQERSRLPPVSVIRATV